MLGLTPSRALPAIAAAIAAAAAASAATTTATAATVAITAATAAFTTTTIAAATAATFVTAATAAIATTATAAAAEAAATTTAAAAALLALLGLVDAERATVEGLAVHALDRLRGFLGGAHGDEREPARATGLAVGHEVDVAYGSELRERSPDAFGGGVKREIANIQTSVHRLLEPAQ